MKRGSKVAFFVTGNVHKFDEARDVLSKYSIATAMLNVEAVEIQDDSLRKIAEASALDAARRTGLPVFVEDAGLFIDTLSGFPGPYSSYVYRTIGTRGILKLMARSNQRNAFFHSFVAFCSSNERGEPLCFEGTVKGRITRAERGQQGFGFDPIFEPEIKSGKTFGQMTTEEKNSYSHRMQALRKFAEWYNDSCFTKRKES